MKNNMVTTIITVVIVGALAFFGGMKYQQSKSSGSQFAGTGIENGGRGGGQFGQRGVGQGRGGVTTGEIINSDDKSITVKMPDGSSKIVLLSDKIQINKAAEGIKSDLKIGTRVAVFGTANSDGSITAQNVQLNPTFGGNGRMPNQATKSADAKEIIVDGSNYKFSPDKITVKKGEKIRIVFKNTDGNHDFRVDELNISTATIRSGEEDYVEFTPDKTGKFEYYCSVGNHRQMGMKGTLVVE